MRFILRGPFLFLKKVYFCKKLRKMTETIATPSATTAQFKAAILELIQENNPELKQWLKTSLSEKPVCEPKNGQVKSTRPRSELPFWKLHPDWEPLIPSKESILTKEKLEKLQELFADAPSAEEIISYLTK
jgi:hypothetical protein